MNYNLKKNEQMRRALIIYVHFHSFVRIVLSLFAAVGFVNGSVRVLDSITLEDQTAEPFRYARYGITQIAFSHNSQYLATAVSIIIMITNFIHLFFDQR